MARTGGTARGSATGPPRGPLLVLSPHLDDAALSCGALLERAEPLTVLDVFTERPEPEQFTEWDEQCGFTGSHEAMAARWREEHQAFGDSPHTFAAVDVLDGQYRDGPPTEGDARRLVRAVDSWLRGAGAAPTVALPVGAGTPHGMDATFAARLRARRAGTFAFGNSPDHIWVRDTVLEHLSGMPAVGIWLYEELPYTHAFGGDRVVPTIEVWTERRAVRHDLPVDREAKARRVLAYESQLALLFRRTDAAGVTRAMPATERYWELRADLA